MKKLLLCFILLLIIAELASRCFLFYYNLKLSYQLNKRYYRFSGTLWDYINEYTSFIKKNPKPIMNRLDQRVIINDPFNRRFYIPNLNIELGWIENLRTNSFGMRERN